MSEKHLEERKSIIRDELKHLSSELWTYNNKYPGNDSNIPFFFFGTLLGYHRDHDVCYGDIDIDLAILSDNFNEEFLYDMLDSIGYKLYLANNVKLNQNINYQFKFRDSRKHVDLSVFENIDDIYYNKGRITVRKWDKWDNYSEFVKWRYYVSDKWNTPHQYHIYPKLLLTETEWGSNLGVPMKVIPYNNAIELFKIIYGETWEEPKFRSEAEFLNRDKLVLYKPQKHNFF